MPHKAQETSEPTASAFGFARTPAFAMLLAATLAFSAPSIAQAAAPLLQINGTTTRALETEHKRIVFVPAQSVFSQLGESVTYRAPLAIIKAKNGTELARLTLGSREASLNGSPHKLVAAPFTAHGALMVPLRFVSEAAGATVTYSTSPRAISIHKSRQSPAAVAKLAAAPAALVAQANPAPQATDATAATGAAQADSGGIPWWVWLLAALLVLGLVLAFLRRGKEPLITTRRTGRSSNPNIRTRK